jgi:hypothetical protein
MQLAKDSFYVTVRDRLGVVNPARTVMVNGVVRPAVMVVENAPPTGARPLPDVFYVSWGALHPAKNFAGRRRPLLSVECSIEYGTAGTLDGQVDRGRVLVALDEELLQICAPGSTPKQDFQQAEPVSLGTKVVWTRPVLGEMQTNPHPGIALGRTAQLQLLFFPEMELP